MRILGPCADRRIWLGSACAFGPGAGARYVAPTLRLRKIVQSTQVDFV
jgi:hypothetical protein